MNIVLEKPTDLVVKELIESLENRLLPQLDQQQEALPSLSLPLADNQYDAVYDPYNERIKLYGVTPQCLSELPPVETDSSQAGKVTAYALPGNSYEWAALGFREEGVIRGYFEDGADAHLWAAYSEAGRETNVREELHEHGIQIALSKSPLVRPELPEGYVCQTARPEDTPEITALLQSTFTDYPSPLVEETIATAIETQANLFRMVLNEDGEVAAVASAEMDHQRSSAEMTDCATRPDQRGKGLMAHILWKLEKDVVVDFDITDLYTIARADEIGMNCVFSKLGYGYSGRLVNNCRMPNGWESMNLWCKSLSK